VIFTPLSISDLYFHEEANLPSPSPVELKQTAHLYPQSPNLKVKKMKLLTLTKKGKVRK